MDEAKRLADDGCREITLLGQNVNSYGKSFTPSADALADLLARLDKITGLARVRFVTSHPKDMSREILEAVRDLPTVCEHLHMPAQSGSDRILAAMNRRYTARGYRDLVALARELVPGIAIASDFIVGFPGETERGIRRDRRARPRPPLPELLRLQVLHAPRHRRREARRRRALGREAPPQHGAPGDSVRDQPRGEPQVHRQEVEVLVEGPSHRDARRLTGRLRTNHIVVFEGPETLAGELVRVRVESATALTLAGTRTPAGDPRPPVS